MKKYLLTAIFLVLVVACSGTVTATANIDIKFIDTSQNTVTEVEVGTPVSSQVEVQNDETPVDDATVEYTWQNDNEWKDDESVYVSLDGGESWAKDPKSVVWSDTEDKFTWNIGNLYANQLAILKWPSIPITAGTEVDQVLLFDGETLMDSDIATLIITEPKPNVNAGTVKTVGMQTTGAPVAALLISLFMVLSGMLISKRQ